MRVFWTFRLNLIWTKIQLYECWDDECWFKKYSKILIGMLKTINVLVEHSERDLRILNQHLYNVQPKMFRSELIIIDLDSNLSRCSCSVVQGMLPLYSRGSSMKSITFVYWRRWEPNQCLCTGYSSSDAGSRIMLWCPRRPFHQDCSCSPSNPMNNLQEKIKQVNTSPAECDGHILK